MLPTEPTYPAYVRWTPDPPPPPPVDIWADPTADDPPDAPCWPGCPVCTDEEPPPDAD